MMSLKLSMKKNKLQWEDSLGIEKKFLEKIFPFFLLLDDQLQLIDAGISIKKTIDVFNPGVQINSILEISYPAIAFTKDSLIESKNDAITFIVKKNPKIKLRGQFIISECEKNFLFISVPMVTEVDSLKEISLNVNDFPIYDPTINMMFLLKAQKKTQEELIESNKKIKSAQAQIIQSAKMASLGQMNAALAHEINNPLTIIKGFASRINKTVLKKTYSKEKIQGYVERIDSACGRISGLIRHMGIYSRQEKLNFTPIHINEILIKSLELMSEQLRLSGIDVKLTLAKNNPALLGEASRLELIFLNFIQNSRHAIKEVHGDAGGEIQIATSVEDNQIVITFEDNGVGMSKEVVKKVFDPFFTTKESGSGTGLGLSISLEVVKEHNGKITCDADRKVGVKFTLKFPKYKLKQVVV